LTTDRRTRLRQLIERPGLDFLMEAHNALAARIAEEAGFQAVWGSGLAISASLGVPDNNEASFSEVLDVAEKMADATDVPILLDADTGYGDHNHVGRVVRLAEKRGVAGLCIEDKLFPKRNSLLGPGGQQLADIREFSSRIHAARAAARHPDFVVVARTEAYIAGAGGAEALERAYAYAEAGAHAVLVHSARSDASEILEFLSRWDGRCPVVVVPTNYASTPTATLAEAGVSVVIWANHLVRASVRAMQQVAAQIHGASSVASLGDDIVSVREIFRLQGQPRVDEANDRYRTRP
jgi:phosphoenolpyruvate phosphomutase